MSTHKRVPFLDPSGGIRRYLQSHQMENESSQGWFDARNMRFNKGMVEQIELQKTLDLTTVDTTRSLFDCCPLLSFTPTSPFLKIKDVDPCDCSAGEEDGARENSSFAIAFNNAFGYTDVYNTHLDAVISNHIINGPYNFNLGGGAIDINSTLYYMKNVAEHIDLYTFQTDGTKTLIASNITPHYGQLNCVLTKEGYLVFLGANSGITAPYHIDLVDKTDGSLLASSTFPTGQGQSYGLIDHNNILWVCSGAPNTDGNFIMGVSVDLATFGNVVASFALTGDHVVNYWAVAISETKLIVHCNTFFDVAPTRIIDLDTLTLSVDTNTPPVRMRCLITDGFHRYAGYYGALYYYDGDEWHVVSNPDSSISVVYSDSNEYYIYVWTDSGYIQKWDIRTGTPFMVLQTEEAYGAPGGSLTLINGYNYRRLVMGL